MICQTLLLVLSFLLFAGTTTIIKEGNVEVGRFENHDGSNAVEVIEQEKPDPIPDSTPAASAARRQPQTAVIGELPQKEPPPLLTPAQVDELKRNQKHYENKIYGIWALLAFGSLIAAWVAYWFRRNFK